jgi:hypothetical protein
MLWGVFYSVSMASIPKFHILTWNDVCYHCLTKINLNFVWFTCSFTFHKAVILSKTVTRCSGQSPQEYYFLGYTLCSLVKLDRCF